MNGGKRPLQSEVSMSRTLLAFVVVSVVAFGGHVAALAAALPAPSGQRVLTCAWVDSEAACAYVAIGGAK